MKTIKLRTGMKRYIITCIAALMGVLCLQAESIRVEDVVMNQGETTNVSISLTNSRTNLVSFQMDLYLPDGITINKSGCSLSNRFETGQTLTIGKQSDGAYRLTSTSFSLKPITGTSGIIISLSLTAQKETGATSASIKNIMFATSSSERVTLNNISFVAAVREHQSVNMTSIPSVTYGDTYTLPSKTDQGQTLTWTVENASVATISGNVIKTKGAGSTTVTATQSGSNCYFPFTKTYTLNVNKASLTISANNNTMVYGGTLPTFSFSCSGFKNGDTSSVLTTQPSYTCIATSSSVVGQYDINISGAEAQNYEITYRKGVLTINAKNSSNLSIDDIADIEYNGLAQTPNVTVKDGTKILIRGTDYDVSYSNNIKVGTAKVTITGKGNYTGTKYATFTIYAIEDVISFADANVKAICVVNWDTNGSGELSEEEAATVTSLGNVFQGKTNITSFEELRYFTRLTAIPNNAFRGCGNLTSIVIPNSVTSIGGYAFENCSGLTSITIPNSVTSIGSSAFSGCSGLISITIPNGVTSIGSSAFYNCDSLTSVTIPSSVTSIGAQAFFGCSSLTSIEIPKSVTTIGNAAFANCSGELIVNCKISSASQSTSGTFYGSKFKSVKIGDGVTSIGSYAFYNCDSLTAVTIPSSVTSIEDYSFYGCENLTRVSINSNTIVGTDELSLYGIFGSQVKEYILGNDVKSIGGGKFSGCTGLAYITIPNSVKTIGNSAFHNCSKLEYITIPNSVTSIGDYALSDCANLKSVTIGSGVQVIGKDVFENHRPAKVFWLTNTPPEGYTYAEGTINYVSNRQYTEFSNVIRYSSLSSIFVVDGIKYVPVSPSERTCDAIDCTYDESIETINIAEKVTNKGIALSVKQVCPYTCFDNKYIKEINLSFKGDIGAKAFYDCSNMTTAELGENILSIGESGFSKCSKLESIVIPDSVVSIKDSTFCDCIALDTVKIGKKVENIGRYAFSGCSVLPDIKIPQGVTSIADYAFRGCRGMKTVVMSNGDSELALSSNGSNPLFADCPLDSVYIGRNILYETSADYGYSPFYRNKTLRTVVITDKETEISENEFYGCTNLQNFKVGDGVTYFGSWAFSGCSSLKSLSFGSQLRIIGQEAFSDCNSVTVIVSKTEIPPICDNQALEDINKWDCKLYVPEGTLSAYQAANQWKDFFFIEDGDPFAILRGDVNGDGVVNGTDIQAIINLIVAGEYDEKADINKDNIVNGTDIQEVINIIVNAE